MRANIMSARVMCACVCADRNKQARIQVDSNSLCQARYFSCMVLADGFVVTRAAIRSAVVTGSSFKLQRTNYVRT
jgi:hypothetical protein